MNRLTIAIIYVNIFGLTASQGLESWRWGAISAIISFSWIWFISLVLLGAAIVLGYTKKQS